jgi:hypothetical protein
MGIETHAAERPVFLFGGEEACCCRRVGHEEEANNTEYDCDSALDY